MRALIFRTIAVAWVAAGALVGFYMIDRGSDGLWAMVLVFLVPVWAAQFILTGIVNPARLFVEAFSRQ